MRTPTLLAALLIGSLGLADAIAAPAAIDHVDPPFWWTGMHDRHLQLI